MFCTKSVKQNKSWYFFDSHLLRTNCIPPKFIESLTPSVTIYEDKAFREIIKFKWGHWGRVLIQYDWCPFKKRNRHRRYLSLSVQRRHVKIEQEEAIWKLAREFSSGTNSTGTLILDFQPPELWEINSAAQPVVFCHGSLSCLRNRHSWNVDFWAVIHINSVYGKTWGQGLKCGWSVVNAHLLRSDLVRKCLWSMQRCELHISEMNKSETSLLEPVPWLNIHNTDIAGARAGQQGISKRSH